MKTIFLGDVFLPEPYTSELSINNFICNLEYPITSSSEGWPDKVNLKSEGNYFQETFGEVPVAVSLANNHIMDYGEDGLQDTITHLEDAGIDYFGAGWSSENRWNPLVLNQGDYSVGLLGYVCKSTSPVFATEKRPGVCPIELQQIKDDISTARSRGADLVVIYLHWGAEEVRLPKPADIETARRLSDCGADLILGQHAHRIQPFEIYDDTPIFYGLGNAIMPDLDVPSYYKDGSPTQRFKKAQSTKNRMSLVVTFDGQAVSTFCAMFDNETFFYIPVEVRQHQFREQRLYDINKQIYHAMFKTSYVTNNLKPLVYQFIRNPRELGFRHLKTLVDLVCTGEYD